MQGLYVCDIIYAIVKKVFEYLGNGSRLLSFSETEEKYIFA